MHTFIHTCMHDYIIQAGPIIPQNKDNGKMVLIGRLIVKKPIPQRPIKRTLAKPLAKISCNRILASSLLFLKYWVIGLYIPPLRLSDYLSLSRLLFWTCVYFKMSKKILVTTNTYIFIFNE